MTTKTAICVIVLASFSIGLTMADCEVTVLVNRPYHADGDILALEVQIENGATPLSMDFYVCLEIAGTFYFYPSFSATDLDHRTISLAPLEHHTETVIPPVELPAQLPAITCTVYSVAFQPGTWTLVSNVAIGTIRMQSSWDDLPPPGYQNTFYFMPGVADMDAMDAQSLYSQVAYDLYSHFDTQGLYARLGVTILDGLPEGAAESTAVTAAEKALSAGISIGYHSGVTCHHTFGQMDDLRQSDRRLNQWESDGRIFNSVHDDMATLTLSRYAEPVVAMRNAMASAHGTGFYNALTQYPDTVVCMNGPIEVEMRRSFNDDPHYADYSPFAVMEFRDWITHRGIYDDDIGEYAGEGFPMQLIGAYDFSKDPSPDMSSANSSSFNEVFGTSFLTWDLLYWDPIRFPDPLPLTAQALPPSGQTGHTDGGFDPPRDAGGTLTGGNELFQKVWDGWRSDLNYDYRVGYGFRQASVQNYVADNARWFLSGGAPQDRIFTHQIPVDFIGNWIRERGSASPFWTAINSFSNAGYTAYFETALQKDLFRVTRILSPRWGFFEYHPDPFMTQDVDFYIASLDALYESRCQIIVPLELYGTADGYYKLIDSQFETAVNQFFASVWPGTSHNRFDQPFFNETWIDYLPPPVRHVSFTGNTLTWDMTIWESHPGLIWTDWNEFQHFAVYRGDTPDFTPGPTALITTTRSATQSGLPSGYYKVLAVSRDGLTSRY